jgi:simple sugar transport system ATP-binding protein
VILARELAKDPKLIVAIQPIRGLDVSAARFVHELLLGRARAGAACLLVSPDLDELLELSDRLAVIYKGRIVGVMSSAEANWERIGLLMGGATTEAAA